MILYLIGNVAGFPKISLDILCDVCVPIPPPNVNFGLLGQRWNTNQDEEYIKEVINKQEIIDKTIVQNSDAIKVLDKEIN